MIFFVSLSLFLSLFENFYDNTLFFSSYCEQVQTLIDTNQHGGKSLSVIEINHTLSNVLFFISKVKRSHSTFLAFTKQKKKKQTIINMYFVRWILLRQSKVKCKKKKMSLSLYSICSLSMFMYAYRYFDDMTRLVKETDRIYIYV